MEQYLMEILTAIIGLAIPFIVTYIKRALSAIEVKAVQELGEKREVAIKAYIVQIVKDIYQKHYTLDNVKKAAKAIELFEEKFGTKVLSESQLEVLIESAYLDLKKELGLIDTTTQKTEITPVQ
jgi:hypothetical protein